MGTECTNITDASFSICITFLSLGGFMFLATLLFWVTHFCKKRRFKNRGTRKPSLKESQNNSQVITSELSGPSKRVWRTQTFFRAPGNVQSFQLPRPIISGNIKHDLKLDSCGEIKD